MIKYRFDAIAALTSIGYYPKKIRDDKLIGEAAMSRLRRGEPVSIATIDTICRLLICQPGDLLEYVPD